MVYALPAVSAALNAAVLVWLIRLTDASGAFAGVRLAAVVWLCAVFPFGLVHHAHGGFPPALTAIETGVELLSLSGMSAILGAWPRRRAAAHVRDGAAVLSGSSMVRARHPEVAI